MSYMAIALTVLASIVIGGFLLGMGLGYLWGRSYEDAGPGDPPLLNRGKE